MDDETKKLFPEVKPNINEIIEAEKKLDGDECITNDEPSPPMEEIKQKDIFVKKKNVKLDVKPKKDKYAHLAAARQKGIETRRRKAAERKAAKEAEKKRKEEERLARREATMQRNREKAKARYHKQKSLQKNVPEQIYKETKPNNYEQIAKQVNNNNNMDFNTFAKYMMKYENMKEAYNNKYKKKPKKQEPIKTPPKKQPFNSPNYPLAHLYNPNMRNTNNYF